MDDGEGQTLGFRVGTEQLVDWKAGRGVERTDGKAMEDSVHTSGRMKGFVDGLLVIGRKTCPAWVYGLGLSEWKARSAMGEPVRSHREGGDKTKRSC